MRHLRKDYERFTDPAGKIGEDEPVFILRAQDAAMSGTLRAWASLHRKGGGKLADAVEKFANEVEEWQHKNHCKVADVPEGAVPE